MSVGGILATTWGVLHESMPTSQRAQCLVCAWSLPHVHNGRNRNNRRRLARAHVRQTGHRVRVVTEHVDYIIAHRDRGDDL